MKRYKSTVLIVIAMLLAITRPPAYPEKPITLAITSGVGSGIDYRRRFVAATIEKHKLLPQPIVVETKTGGSGMVGMSYIAGKKKDPYYLIGFTPIHILTPLQGKSPITYRDFTPICQPFLRCPCADGQCEFEVQIHEGCRRRRQGQPRDRFDGRHPCRRYGVYEQLDPLSRRQGSSLSTSLLAAAAIPWRRFWVVMWI